MMETTTLSWRNSTVYSKKIIIKRKERLKKWKDRQRQTEERSQEGRGSVVRTLEMKRKKQRSWEANNTVFTSPDHNPPPLPTCPSFNQLAKHLEHSKNPSERPPLKSTTCRFQRSLAFKEGFFCMQKYFKPWPLKEGSFWTWIHFFMEIWRGRFPPPPFKAVV